MPSETAVNETAVIILHAFKQYLDDFLIITKRSKELFEKGSYKDIQKNSVERMDLYDKTLRHLLDVVHKRLSGENTAQYWILVKNKYGELIADYCNKNIAETFFNSLSRKVFSTKGLNRDLEFFYLKPKADKESCGPLIFKSYKPGPSTADLLSRIIKDKRFRGGFNSLERDIAYAANEIDLVLWPFVRENKDYSIQVIQSCFYRNKVAYIVGRISVNSSYIPLLIPLYNDDTGIYIDSVLFDAEDIYNIFGFYYSYFQIYSKLPNQLISFLRSILPAKPRSELFNSIGFIRHGKTEFYCDLHRFVHLSKEKFEFAPGQEGAVMIVFTLPNYNYVFKVIKDKPLFLRSSAVTDKVISKTEVKRKYDFVRNSDRVGRLVDTQEFEYIKFKIKRFNEELLQEFKVIGTDSIFFSGNHVIINHLYVQRKVTPLPIYFQKENNINLIRNIVIDFGYFIKDLVAAGLFPADLFNSWNYGVTENNRIVLYDYDDVVPLNEVNFRVKPKPRIEFEEMSPEEDWITAEKNDFFMDEIEKFLAIPGPLEGVFRSVHKDLYTLDFWVQTKEQVLKGEVIDIIPYDRSKRFKYKSREV